MSARVTSAEHRASTNDAADPSSGKWQWRAAGLLGLGLLVCTVVATAIGQGDGFLQNADEGVAALLPVDLWRGNVSILFPGNAYQGVLELPAYAASWLAFGANSIPLRLLHQSMWLGALVIWSLVAFDALDRTQLRSSRASRGWGALAAMGLLGVTSVNGWMVWIRIYPGYHSGALLAGLGVLLALRATTDRTWFWAGLAAGLAVYAQPMHGVGVLVVGLLALTLVPEERWRHLVRSIVGVLVGVAPLVLWNARNGFELFDQSAQPVQHSEWTYLQRLDNSWQVTLRVLWGEDITRSSAMGGFALARVVATMVLVVMLGAGLVALLQTWRRTWPLLVGVGAMLFGLPALGALSLQSDLRYAVAWWPALILLVACGASSLIERTHGNVRRVVPAVLVVGMVAQVSTLALGALPQLDVRDDFPSSQTSTADLASDLRRCGVDVAVGDYWGVYVVAWASRATLDAAVPIGLQRLTGLAPERWATERRAALLPPEQADIGAWEQAITAATGRGAAGWLATVHVPSQAVVLLEVEPDGPLPDGCLGPDGFEPTWRVPDGSAQRPP